MLAFGAHIDSRNSESHKPSVMLQSIPGCKINVLQYTTLRCLAASAIVANKVPFESEVPLMLEEFIKAH